ncbi:hypothetical protein, conserved [Eimeria brunetti]|uniref:Uncharacterized protein n=1 Tax=Eimeria brunetti TaxID=51314 RepID=U6LEJ3_9EIME|nr:hypothetical protein, conserved [Eimeria brunetti]
MSPNTSAHTPLLNAVEEEGLLADAAATACGEVPAAAAERKKPGVILAGAQSDEAVLTLLRERFSRTLTGEAAPATAATEHPAEAAAASMAPKVSSSHAGAMSWSRVPGFCGACGAPTSLWSCRNGGPPWLPLTPHSRLHLRLLWDFYAASLPTSCSLMQEAIRLGDLSALRAEAALLSLISRALGFTNLSASAKRVAEICDLTDAGTPSPAWGPHHPLAAAEWTSFSRPNTSGAKSGVQQQQYKHQPCTAAAECMREHAFSCSNHYSGGAAVGGSQPFEGASVSKCGRRVRVVGGCSSSPALQMAGTEKGLSDPGVPEADIIRAVDARSSRFAEGCNERKSSGLSAPMLHLLTQQQNQCPAQVKTNRCSREQEELAKEQQYGPLFSGQSPHRQRLQWQQHPVGSEEQAFYACPGQREQRQQKNYAEAHLDGLHSCVGTIGEAVAVCLIDLHLTKAKLAPLFQEGTTAAAAVAPVAPSEYEAAAEQTNLEAAQSNYFEGLQHSRRALTATGAAGSSVGAAAAAGGKTAAIPTVASPVVAAKAAIAAAKTALRHAATWGRMGLDAVVGIVSFVTPSVAVWLPASLQGTFRCAAAPRHLFLKVSGKASSAVAATSLAASNAAAAIAAAQGRRAVWPKRAAVLLGQWLRVASPLAASSGGSVPLLQLLPQAFLAVEVAARREWGSCCYCVNRLARQLATTLQHGLRLLFLWRNPRFVKLETSAPLSPWPGGTCSISTDCRKRDNVNRTNRRRRSGSPWTTPEGLRPRGSTSSCYWSPMENSPGLCSPKKPAEYPISYPSLPVAWQQGKQQAQFIDLEQQLLHHHLQVGPPPSPSESATPPAPYVTFRDPAARGKLLSGTLPVMRLAGLDHGSKHREGRLHKGNSFRRLPKVDEATRAAAAGAAAAAATASWGAGVSQCHNIRACEFPTSDKFRGVFDLLFVTDLLNSPRARIKTLECLLHLLDARTDCIIVHAWRSPEAERDFFEALGKCLLVSRLDGQRDIQKRCMQAISRSIADSARDIHEATDEDGSIDIFSVKPHADVSESVWRSEVENLLLQLQRDDVTQKGTHSYSTPLAIEAAQAAFEEAATLSSAEKGTSRHTVSLSSCSTLSSMQGGVQLTHSTPSSGIRTPAERWIPDKDLKEKPGSLHQRGRAESVSAQLLAKAARMGANALSGPGRLRNTSQLPLHQEQLPPKNVYTVEAAPKIPKAALKGTPPVTAFSRERGPSTDAARVRPKTSTTPSAAARSGHLNIQQRLSVNGDGSPSKRKAVATPSKDLMSPCLSPAEGGPASAYPLSPLHALPATATAAKKPSAAAKGRILHANVKPTHLEARECRGGMRSTAPAAAASQAAAITPQQEAEANLINSTVMGTTSPTKNSTENISSDGMTAALKPAAAAAAITGVTAKPAVQKSPKSARPQTSTSATQPSSKRLGPLLPALGTPNAQLRRAAADGSPTAPHEAAVACEPLPPRQKSFLENAANKTVAAATAISTAAAAPTETTSKPTTGHALAVDKCTAPNTGASQQMLKVAAAGPTPRQPLAAGQRASKSTMHVAGGGPPRLRSATAGALKPVTGAPTSVSGPKHVVHAAPDGAKAATVAAAAHKPEDAWRGATKAVSVAAGARGQPDRPRVPVETKADTVPVCSKTAPGPLGARLVSRLSGLFKRTGSREVRSK